MVDESKLLRRLQKRQKNSIEQAIEIYTPYLSTVIYNTAGTGLSREDSEEIVSDVFTALWKNADRIDLKKGTVRSYIAAAARNLALKKLSKKRECVCIDTAELTDEQNTAENNMFSEFLWKSVMELGEPDSEIFVRYYKYDEKLKDISNATGLNLSTVKSKLLRGKQKLKKILLNAEAEL